MWFVAQSKLSLQSQDKEVSGLCLDPYMGKLAFFLYRGVGTTTKIGFQEERCMRYVGFFSLQKTFLLFLTPVQSLALGVKRLGRSLGAPWAIYMVLCNSVHFCVVLLSQKIVLKKKKHGNTCSCH